MDDRASRSKCQNAATFCAHRPHNVACHTTIETKLDLAVEKLLYYIIYGTTRFKSAFSLVRGKGPSKKAENETQNYCVSTHNKAHFLKKGNCFLKQYKGS